MGRKLERLLPEGTTIRYEWGTEERTAYIAGYCGNADFNLQDYEDGDITKVKDPVFTQNMLKVPWEVLSRPEGHELPETTGSPKSSISSSPSRKSKEESEEMKRDEDGDVEMTDVSPSDMVRNEEKENKDQSEALREPIDLISSSEGENSLPSLENEERKEGISEESSPERKEREKQPPKRKMDSPFDRESEPGAKKRKVAEGSSVEVETSKKDGKSEESVESKDSSIEFIGMASSQRNSVKAKEEREVEGGPEKSKEEMERDVGE